MKKTPSVVIIIGCLLIFTNISAAGISLVQMAPIQKNEVIIISDIETSLDSISPSNEEETEETTSIDALEQEDPSIQISTKSKTPQIHLHEQRQTFALANAGGPYSGDVGTLLSFYGSSAVISPGTTYKWDFGDGTITYGLRPTHTYASPGRYIVTFTVTKSSGEKYLDMAPVYIEVENDHLTPYGKCCYYGKVDEPISFDASLSTSEDPNLPIVSYKWYFGDGTVGHGKKVTHTYTEEGPYFVQLEVKDATGNTRIDVLHADVDCKLEKMDDFFISSSPLLEDILSFIEKIKKQYLFGLLNTRIITIHNGNEKVTSVPNGYGLPQIDVDDDNQYDLKIEDISFFTLEKTYSDFTGRFSLSWKSSFSVDIYENGDIKDDDDFSISLQFTFGSLITQILGIEEPVIDIGYSSESGEEKTSEFTIEHQFRPYILERFWLWFGGDSQNNQQNAQSTPTGQTTYETLPFGLSSENEMIASNPVYAPIGVINIKNEVDDDQTISSESVDITEIHECAQEETVDIDDFYPENEVIVQDIDVDSFSLLMTFANSRDPTLPYYRLTELKLSYDTLVDSTIKSKRFQDVGFEGSDSTGDSSLTLTLSRLTNSRKATLGIIIDPIDNFISKVDHNKDSSGLYTLEWSIDNPPENIVLFAESEDAWGDYNSNYFYIENIPEVLTIKLMPKLEDGYIDITRSGADECKVGIKNDLKEPTANLYLTHPAVEGIRLDWELLSQPHSIKLETTTVGLSFHAELKDVTQEDQMIVFDATVVESLELDVEWSFIQGYFSVQKSVTEIAFEALYDSNIVNLLVTGSYSGDEGNGITIDFNGFEGQGKVEIDTGREILLQVSAENKNTGSSLSTGIDFARDGHLIFEWDETTALRLDTSHALSLTQMNLNSNKFKFTADEIALESSSDFSIRGEDKNQIKLSGSNQVTLNNTLTTIGFWSSSLDYSKSVGSFDIIVKPEDKYFKVNSLSLIHI